MNEDRWGTLEETGYKGGDPILYRPIGAGFEGKVLFDIGKHIVENGKPRFFKATEGFGNSIPRW